jgi:hypothetical protein
MAIFIDGPEVKITRVGDTTVQLEVYNGETYPSLEPKRLFPRSSLTQYVTLMQPGNDKDISPKEIAIIRNMENLDADSRKAIEECFENYYMIPQILEVLDVAEKYGAVSWTCRTDRGVITFKIRNRLSDIKLLYDGRVLIRDSADNRYEIPNVDKLDKKSKKLLANEL